ncbi:MAG: AbrB/MazE/SpoVT family DNA-binding domain-containing protein [Candidatus Omnitrophota bacterium]
MSKNLDFLDHPQNWQFNDKFINRLINNFLMASNEDSILTFQAKRGKRLLQNLLVLRQQRSNGQFSITIPCGVAKALRLQGGDYLEVFIERGDIVLRPIRR